VKIQYESADSGLEGGRDEEELSNAKLHSLQRWARGTDDIYAIVRGAER
jgi:hypothetical protein